MLLSQILTLTQQSIQFALEQKQQNKAMKSLDKKLIEYLISN